MSSGCCLPPWQLTCHQCPSPYTCHKARPLLVCIPQQESWARVSSPDLTSLLDTLLSAGFPPHTANGFFARIEWGTSSLKGGPWAAEPAGLAHAPLLEGVARTVLVETKTTPCSSRLDLSSWAMQCHISNGCLLGTACC